MKRIGVLMLILIVFVWAQQSRPQTAANKRPTDSDLIVVDSTGKTIGPVISVGDLGQTVVAFPFQESLLPLGVQRTSFTQDVPLWFTSSNCTGQPFHYEGFSPFPASVVSGSTLYVADGPSQSIVAASNQTGSGPCFRGFPTFTFSDAVPVKPAVNLNVFTPPFRVLSQKEKETEKEKE